MDRSQLSALRRWVASLLWTAVTPVRVYVRYTSVERGKWRLTRLFLYPVLSLFPQDMTVLATIPGGRVRLKYSEDLGRAVLIAGAFEAAEIDEALARAAPGTWAVDVGANVGLFSVALSRKVGAEGRVLAFEPDPGNVERLRENCADNLITNVIVHELALSDSDGQVQLKRGRDSAYGSTVEVIPGKESGEQLSVPTRTLDGVWADSGRPLISVIKIDVEGAELQVLRGAAEVLRTCRPTLILEANSASAFAEECDWLKSVAYTHIRRQGFQPWNHLFVAGEPEA